MGTRSAEKEARLPDAVVRTERQGAGQRRALPVDVALTPARRASEGRWNPSLARRAGVGRRSMAVAEQTTSEPTQVVGVAHVPEPGTLLDWLTTVDHKKLGLLYIFLSLFFLVVGGIEALLMRWQLMWPNYDFLPPDTFNSFFTMHGTTMVFFVGMPILIGLGNYFVPLMIGARDMAFPRLNAFGFWATLFGGLLVYFSFATGGGAAPGGVASGPLSGGKFGRRPAA